MPALLVLRCSRGRIAWGGGRPAAAAALRSTTSVEEGLVKPCILGASQVGTSMEYYSPRTPSAKFGASMALQVKHYKSNYRVLGSSMLENQLGFGTKF